jgi:predicted GNAT family N-acyltransferase
LVSYVGAVVRTADHNGNPARIGGIGAVKTKPRARGHGFAAAGLTKAMEFFGATDPPIHFGLLVCNESLLGYYTRFGWREFGGNLFTSQKGETEVFTFNKVMVVDIAGLAPTTGSIDLNGPPW